MVSGAAGEGAQALIRLSWVSRYGDVKERSLYKVISRTLTQAHVTSLDYSGQLRSDALFYRRLREGDATDHRERDVWLGLATVRAQSAYALLIAANRHLSEEARRRISAGLFSLIARHNIICDKDRAKFESAMFAAAKTISDGGSENNALVLLRALSPTNDEVRQNFATLSFPRSQNSIAQCMLRPLEYALRGTEELIIDTPEKVHLEHIYPQIPAVAERWPNHDEYVGRIGNLTLLDRRLNQEAQNAAFATKKEEFYAHSHLLLTRELLEKNAWTEAEVNNRQSRLCELAINVWPQNLV